jgi:hypothetical protein
MDDSSLLPALVLVSVRYNRCLKNGQAFLETSRPGSDIPAGARSICGFWGRLLAVEIGQGNELAETLLMSVINCSLMTLPALDSVARRFGLRFGCLWPDSS